MRRLKTKFGAKLIQKFFAGSFPNSHRAIALHVAVAAHGAQASTWLAELPAQKHHVDDFLNVRDRILVLRQAHGPAKDHALRFYKDARGIFDFDFRDPGLFED